MIWKISNLLSLLNIVFKNTITQKVNVPILPTHEEVYFNNF